MARRDEQSTVYRLCWRVLVGALVLGIIGIVSSNWLSSSPQHPWSSSGSLSGAFSGHPSGSHSPSSGSSSGSSGSFSGHPSGSPSGSSSESPGSPLISESLTSSEIHGSSGSPTSSWSLVSSGLPEPSASPGLSSGSSKFRESSGSLGSLVSPGFPDSSTSPRLSSISSSVSIPSGSTGSPVPYVSLESSESSGIRGSSGSLRSPGSSDSLLSSASNASLGSSGSIESPVSSGSSESLGPSGSPGLSGSSDLTIYNLGLWGLCISYYRCASLPSTQFPDSYGPVRVLCIVAMALHVLSVLLGFIWSFVFPGHRSGILSCLTHLEEFFAAVAGMMLAGGLAIFVQATSQHPVYRTLHLGWAFWVTLLYSCLLLVCCGAIAFSRDDCTCRKRQKACSCKRKTSCMCDQLVEDSDFSLSMEYSDDEYPADSVDDKLPQERKDPLGHKNGSVHSYTSLEGLHRML